MLLFYFIPGGDTFILHSAFSIMHLKINDHFTDFSSPRLNRYDSAGNASINRIAPSALRNRGGSRKCTVFMFESCPAIQKSRYPSVGIWIFGTPEGTRFIMVSPGPYPARNSPPDCFVPSLRSGWPFESLLAYQKAGYPVWDNPFCMYLRDSLRSMRCESFPGWY